MSIPRTKPGRKQGSSTSRMSKTTSNSPSNLEKRDKDQHESQDTNQPIPTIHEENSPEKKVLQALSKFPCENYYGPHPPLFFSSHTGPATAFLKDQTRQKPESTCPLDTVHHYCWIQSTQYPPNT